MTPQLLEPALEAVAGLVARPGRRLVGIAGPPGAGKSTLAEALAAAVPRRLGVSSVAVPMDGFHLANAELARLGLADRKGAPETFDATGFVHLLRRLREGSELVYAPRFDRRRNESIGSAIPVPPDVRLVVVEGNYLLLSCPPWSAVRGLLDLAVYVDLAAPARHRLLVRRQRERGLDQHAARDWVMRSDEANAAIIAGTRELADVVLRREP